MKYICVFCGSSNGQSPDYVESARKFGEAIAKRGFGLVYGGASIGVMGAVADGVLAAGGEVVGVIPESLVNWEVAHDGLTKLHIVDSMHTRKKMMYDLSEVFIAIPGGMGTLDELCEIVTWSQLKLHTKPCFVLNENNFYRHLIAHFDHICEQGFLSTEHRAIVTDVLSQEDLWQRIDSHLA